MARIGLKSFQLRPVHGQGRIQRSDENGKVQMTQPEGSTTENMKTETAQKEFQKVQMTKPQKTHQMKTELQQVHLDLFASGSKTYYNATRFFPDDLKKKVTLLYAFVRKADSLVDDVPQDEPGFRRFCTDFQDLRHAYSGSPDAVLQDGVDPVIGGFVELEGVCGFDPAWADAFLYSMELDLHKSEYNTLDETLEYIYGSAEVIGLFMARIMELPDEALYGAKMLGRAMQYINFLRDIHEDIGLGRRYIPLGDASFDSLNEAETRKHPREFEAFIRRELQRFTAWQEEADAAFAYIPRNFRIPVRTASDMYLWTAEQIFNDPWIIYTRQVKPSKPRIMLRGLANVLRGGMPRKIAYATH